MWDLPDQGSNPCLLLWQADSLPLSHQGGPLYGSYSTLLLWSESSHKQFVNEWAWLCSTKTLFMDTEIWISHYFTCLLLMLVTIKHVKSHSELMGCIKPGWIWLMGYRVLIPGSMVVAVSLGDSIVTSFWEIHPLLLSLFSLSQSPIHLTIFPGIISKWATCIWILDFRFASGGSKTKTTSLAD